MEIWNLLLDIVLLLIGALLLGGLFSRLGQTPIVGYLLAGMILGGPGSVRLLELERDLETIAELGVSLLLFSLGLEFSWSRLRRLGTKALVSGLAQIVITGLVGTLAAAGFGLPLREAVAVGAIVALSSTACVLRLLIERAEIDTQHGRSSLAILLVQDVAVVPAAILITLLGGQGTPGEVAFGALKTILSAVAVVAVLYVLLNKVAVWALGTLTFERNRELTVLLAIVTGLGAAWAAHAVGLSPAIGAFLAGLFLAGSPFATQIRADISALRIVLLTLFFGAAGMVADPLWMIQNAGLVIGVTLCIILAKLLIVWAVLRILGHSHASGFATGVCLAQIGEFAFVLVSMGRVTGVVSDQTSQILVSSAILSLFLTAFLLPAAARLGSLVDTLLTGRTASTLDAPAVAPHTSPDVVIIGFGPAGRATAQPLLARGQRVTVVDLSRAVLRLAEAVGLETLQGDATRREVLEHAHVAAARAVIISTPSHVDARLILDHVRRLAPQAQTIVRSRHDRHRMELAAAGAHVVISDEHEAGRGLAAAVAKYLDSSVVDASASAPTTA